MVDKQKKDNPELGTLSKIKHEIKLIDENKRVISKEYRIPQSMIPKAKEYIEKLLNQGIIRKSNSSFCSPAFFVPKKNGEFRFVVDLRKLNENTIKETYPIPRIDDLLLELAGSKIFSQIDFNQGFHQIELQEEHKERTAFSMLNELYEYNRMPMGATNSPRTFQRAMKSLFGGLSFVKVYLDDLLIHSETEEEHVKHIKQIFDIIKDNGISINFNKSKFNQREVTYLRVRLSEKGIEPDKDLLNTFEFKTPKTKKSLQRIIGFINYFRAFVKNMSKKMSKINNKLSEKVFNWNDEDTKILQNLLEEIKNDGLLTHPDPNKQFEIRTDASDEAIGGVLLQDKKPVRFFSKKLLAYENNYTVVEKECLSIIKSLEFFRSIIYGRKIRILTDSKNLIYIKSAESSRVQRWKLKLEEFDYQLEHLPRENNVIADCLSREFKQTKVHHIQTVENVKKIHEELCHPGKNKLYMTLKSIFQQKYLKKIIEKITEECHTCQLEKDTAKKYGLIQSEIYSNEPFQTVATDITAPISLEDFKCGGESIYNSLC